VRTALARRTATADPVGAVIGLARTTRITRIAVQTLRYRHIPERLHHKAFVVLNDMRIRTRLRHHHQLVKRAAELTNIRVRSHHIQLTKHQVLQRAHQVETAR
jgi:hypothetical protein